LWRGITNDFFQIWGNCEDSKDKANNL